MKTLNLGPSIIILSNNKLRNVHYPYFLIKIVSTTNDLRSNIDIRKTFIKSMRKVGVSPPLKVEFILVFQILVVKFTVVFTRT